MMNMVKLGRFVKASTRKNKGLVCTDVYSVTNSVGFISSTDYFSKEVFSKELSNYKLTHSWPLTSCRCSTTAWHRNSDMEREKDHMCDDDVAILSSNGDMTSFSYGDTTIRFKTSKSLVRYTSVKRWDAGYIECDAIYRDLEEPVEEYIDLVPILENLYFRPSEFLQDIREVIVRYDR